MNDIESRAHDILTAQGTDPSTCCSALYSAACETARSDLKVEAARKARKSGRLMANEHLTDGEAGVLALILIAQSECEFEVGTPEFNEMVRAKIAAGEARRKSLTPNLERRMLTS